MRRSKRIGSAAADSRRASGAPNADGDLTGVDSFEFFPFVGRERDATNSELELGQRDDKTSLGL